MSTFPTAYEIASAIVAAARLVGEDPLSVFDEAVMRRCRPVAFAALGDAFPEARKQGVARCLGWRSNPRQCSAKLIQARKTNWWREEFVDEVVGVLVADRYGSQAA